MVKRQFTSIELHGLNDFDEDGNLARETGKGFVTSEHTPFDSEECDGWNVWVRIDYPNYPHDGSKEPFESCEVLDRFFFSLEAAEEYASTLSELSGLEVNYY